MSENLKRLERINEGEGKKQSNKGNEISKSKLLEKTQGICMPSNKKKMDITDLLPFNLLGNKAELLSDSIGGLVEIGANTSDRVIDAFAGTGAYIHYLRDMGFKKPMILNEIDPYRFVTHRQIKDNPAAVSIIAERYVRKIKDMQKTLKAGNEFGPAAEETRKKVVDYMDKEAKRLVERRKNTPESFEDSSIVKLRNTPSVAALYTVMQNQKQNYFPINADASEEGLEKVMRYVHNKTITKENKKVVLNRTGGRILRNPRKRILSVSKRLQNVDIHYGDAWELIYEIAGKGDFVLVDPSYLGKITENYNKSTREDSDPEVYMNKVRKYILPVFDRGAKFLITNNWNDSVVNEFRQLGFTVFKAERAKMQSKGKPELVAINFNPISGVLNPIGRPPDIDSYAGIKKVA